MRRDRRMRPHRVVNTGRGYEFSGSGAGGADSGRRSGLSSCSTPVPSWGWSPLPGVSVGCSSRLSLTQVLPLDGRGRVTRAAWPANGSGVRTRGSPGNRDLDRTPGGAVGLGAEPLERGLETQRGEPAEQLAEEELQLHA